MSVVDDLFSVRGQVALVTGGASGLGYAFSSILADAGATVVIADWDAGRPEEGGRGRCAAGRRPRGQRRIQLDVSDAAAVRAAVDAIVGHAWPHRHRLRQRGHRARPAADAARGLARRHVHADYNTLIDINLHGVVYTVQAAARHMKRARSGSIVTTASTAGLRNDPFTPYSYTIAKAGVINFTKQAAHDLARWGVRVNAIAPGPFKTHLGGKEPTSADADAMWSAVVPLGRMGNPPEIRGLALLLASNAGSFMTGGVYPIDGGALLQGPSLPPLA